VRLAGTVTPSPVAKRTTKLPLTAGLDDAFRVKSALNATGASPGAAATTGIFGREFVNPFTVTDSVAWVAADNSYGTWTFSWFSLAKYSGAGSPFHVT
jgi:hypothetical protein